MNTNIDKSLEIKLIGNKIIGIEYSLSHINSTITLIENNIISRKSRGLSTEEAEKELTNKKNDIIKLNNEKTILLEEMEVLNNGVK